jgi:uncharacterized protein (TIRG00374 family)
MKTGLARIARWALTGAVLVLLIIVAFRVNWHDIWHVLSHASMPLVLAATVVNFVSLGLKGVRWWIFLRPAGARSLGLALRATVAGAGLNNLLVASGGEAARVMFVSRASNVPSSAVLASLALERLFDAVGFVVFLVVAGLVIPLPEQLARWRIPAEGLLVVLMAMLFVLARREANEDDAPETGAPVRSLFHRMQRYLSRAGNSVTELSSLRRFGAALVVTVLVWSTQLATYALAAQAAHAPLPPAGNVATLLAANLAFLIRTTPGNVGVFQLTYTVAAVPFGVSQHAAIATAVLLQALQAAPVTIIGVALAPEFLSKKGRGDTTAKY